MPLSIQINIINQKVHHLRKPSKKTPKPPTLLKTLELLLPAHKQTSTNRATEIKDLRNQIELLK